MPWREDMQPSARALASDLLQTESQPSAGAADGEDSPLFRNDARGRVSARRVWGYPVAAALLIAGAMLTWSGRGGSLLRGGIAKFQAAEDYVIGTVPFAPDWTPKDDAVDDIEPVVTTVKPAPDWAPKDGAVDDIETVVTTVKPATTTIITTTSTTGVDGPRPALFCWSHMQQGGYEEVLIREQLKREASIFACNGFAVISTASIDIGTYRTATVFTWENPAPAVGMGQYGVNGAQTDSFLNTQTFLVAYDSLIGSGKIWLYDFVVKVDPDAVFFPDRLRTRVAEHVGQPVYYANCGKYGGEPQLYGSIEVFSVPALGSYQARIADCKQLPWQGWGEDYYMQHCMDMIGVQMVYDGNQVGDGRCMYGACDDYNKVAFHPFKDTTSWFDCYNTAIGR